MHRPPYVVAIGALIFTLSTAQSSPHPTQPASSVATTPIPSSNKFANALVNEEILLLREQNKIIREYHDSILNTVFWALGGVFGTTLLVGGFGWLSNFKLYESDKRGLRKELATQIREHEAKTQATIDTNRLELERTFDTRSDSHLARLSSENSDIRLQINTNKEDIATQAKDISELRADLLLVEEYVWKLNGIPGNILITQVQGLNNAINAGNSLEAKRILSRIKETIKTEFLDKNTPLNNKAFNVIQKNLINASQKHGVEVSQIQELLGKVIINPANS